MCTFLSFVSDPVKPIPERFMYMDWPTRKKILAGKLNYEADSHTSIADFYGYKGKDEDTLNKYEYNPLLGKFQVDQINNSVNDAIDAKKWVRQLNFKKVVAPLVIKPIINPFKTIPPEITPEVLELLRHWASSWASVRASVRDSIGTSVWASVRASVRDSIGTSVWDSVQDSIWAYMTSFFKVKYAHDFSSAVKLWEMGLVPTSDRKMWRLHGGKDGGILWEGVL